MWTDILKEESNTTWIGRVKKMTLFEHTMQILTSIGMYEENMIEELVLDAYKTEHITEILKTGNKNILAWIEKVKKLELRGYAIQILPKLRIHKENVIKELVLCARKAEHITEILKTENKSTLVWIEKMKKLELCGHAIQLLSRLRIPEENKMKELVLNAYNPEHIIEILELENKTIWIGKIRKLRLFYYAIQILPKLGIHGENVMEELYLNACFPEYIYGILEEKDKSIWIGRVWRINLEGHANEIKDKLDFTEIKPDGKEEIVSS
ncbi:MAG: uncharacterized protein A8A55_1652 [Amphiamblys sp. WSBS2006]|nr:MAG: uncharacterized protein A8A55_1652 [Amphiamblys sp. WSBS2006]